MKILGVNEFKIFNVRTDIPDFGGEFRRVGKGVWERLIGESWEPCYTNEDELEKAFKEYMNSIEQGAVVKVTNYPVTTENINRFVFQSLESIKKPTI